MKQIIINRQVVTPKLLSILQKNDISFREIEVDTKPCPFCNKEFVTRGVGTVNERKFCSVTCRSRFNARVGYEFIKDNPEYKQKKKEYFSKWRKENREHFNDLVREPMRIKRKENYHKWDKLGLCTNCGKKRDNPNSKVCNKCYKTKCSYNAKDGLEGKK